MAYYRLYLLGSATGGIFEAREFEADGDEAAIALSEEMSRWAAMELWSGERKVQRWDGRGLGARGGERHTAG